MTDEYVHIIIWLPIDIAICVRFRNENSTNEIWGLAIERE